MLRFLTGSVFVLAHYLPVAPVLVAFHTMAVIQSDGAVLTNSIEAEFSGVQGISRPDVLSPAKRENLATTGNRDTLSLKEDCQGISFIS